MSPSLRAMLVLLLTIAALALASPARAEMVTGIRVAERIAWDGYDDTVILTSTPDGPRYVVVRDDGVLERLTPDEFAARMLAAAGSRSPVERLLENLFNTSRWSGIAWVVFGLAGQGLFAGRMVIQWWTSERRRESVVPPIFWWLSLVGSSMLLTYFLWRRDIVGILGQSLGLGIYVRNLILIRNTARRQALLDGEASPA